MDGRELADRVAVANLEPGGLVGVLHVLRRATHRGVGPDAVAFPNGGMAFDGGMRADPGAAANPHVGTDNGKRTDGHVGGKLCLRVDQCAGMDLRHTSCPVV
ncbi:hypothetical protein D3C86_1884050 [compost metagenome]